MRIAPKVTWQVVTRWGRPQGSQAGRGPGQIHPKVRRLLPLPQREWEGVATHTGCRGRPAPPQPLQENQRLVFRLEPHPAESGKQALPPWCPRAHSETRSCSTGRPDSWAQGEPPEAGPGSGPVPWEQPAGQPVVSTHGGRLGPPAQKLPDAGARSKWRRGASGRGWASSASSPVQCALPGSLVIGRLLKPPKAPGDGRRDGSGWGAPGVSTPVLREALTLEWEPHHARVWAGRWGAATSST